MRIRESLNSVDWSNILRYQGVHNAWNIFHNILKVTIDSIVPFTSENRKRKPGWLSNELKVKLTHKKLAWKANKEAPSYHMLEQYKLLERKLKADIRQAKSLQETNHVKNIKENPNKFLICFKEAHYFFYNSFA